jgi:outer membrane receptor protein involved in Fe transport
MLGQDKTELSHLTPRLTVLFRPSSADTLKFISGQGFRFPTIFEAYYSNGSTEAADPALRPEVLTSEQVDWSHRWSSRLSSHASVFCSSNEHSIVQMPGESGLAQYINAPNWVKNRSAELEATWHQRGTQISGGVGYYDWSTQAGTVPGTQQIQNGSIPGSSRWLGVFKVIQRVNSYSVAGEARYVDARQNPYTLSGIPAKVPANWTLRTSVRREWSDCWAQFSIEDLTNSRRRDLVAAEYSPATWMEEDGRALRGTFGVKF